MPDLYNCLRCGHQERTAYQSTDGRWLCKRCWAPVATLATQVKELVGAAANPEPAPTRPPISPPDCRHVGRLLVESSRDGPPHRSHAIYICPRCGQFDVSGDVGGVVFKLSFTLPTGLLVEAAGRHARYLEQEEQGHP